MVNHYKKTRGRRKSVSVKGRRKSVSVKGRRKPVSVKGRKKSVSVKGRRRSVKGNKKGGWFGRSTRKGTATRNIESCLETLINADRAYFDSKDLENIKRLYTRTHLNQTPPAPQTSSLAAALIPNQESLTMQQQPPISPQTQPSSSALMPNQGSDIEGSDNGESDNEGRGESGRRPKDLSKKYADEEGSDIGESDDAVDATLPKITNKELIYKTNKEIMDDYDSSDGDHNIIMSTEKFLDNVNTVLEYSAVIKTLKVFPIYTFVIHRYIHIYEYNDKENSFIVNIHEITDEHSIDKEVPEGATLIDNKKLYTKRKKFIIANKKFYNINSASQHTSSMIAYLNKKQEQNKVYEYVYIKCIYVVGKKEKKRIWKRLSFNNIHKFKKHNIYIDPTKKYYHSREYDPSNSDKFYPPLMLNTIEPGSYSYRQRTWSSLPKLNFKQLNKDNIKVYYDFDKTLTKVHVYHDIVGKTEFDPYKYENMSELYDLYKQKVTETGTNFVEYLFGDIQRQNFIKYLLTQINEPKIFTKNKKEIVELALSELDVNVEIIDPFDPNDPNILYDKLYRFEQGIINHFEDTHILFDDFDVTDWVNVNNMLDQVYNFRKNIAKHNESKYIICNIDPSTGITPKTFFEILPNLSEDYEIFKVK